MNSSMDLSRYLTPINPDNWGYYPSEMSVKLGSVIDAYLPGSGLPEIPKGGLVLVGVEEDRAAEGNAGCAQAPNEIRRYLYQLAMPVKEMSIVDLGNVIVGQIPDDTYYAVAEIVSAVVGNGSTLILLGGSQDLTFAAYKGYELMNRIINITSIDAKFDLEQDDDEVTSRSWLRHIIMQTPNYLFFHSNVGYQTYFVGPKYVDLMEDLKFDAYRLGEIQNDMDRAESLLRNADLVTVDLGAVRQSDAPANGNPSPHGFYGEELCRMMRFAGMSDKTHCIGVFELNPRFDNHGQTAHMVAQALWYFIEGYYGRKHDNPTLYPENCKHFILDLSDEDVELHFYKSKLSDRWWVNVPCENEEKHLVYGDSLMVPCTYADYQLACKGDIPPLWWRYFKQLN